MNKLLFATTLFLVSKVNGNDELSKEQRDAYKLNSCLLIAEKYFQEGNCHEALAYYHIAEKIYDPNNPNQSRKEKFRIDVGREISESVCLGEYNTLVYRLNKIYDIYCK